MHDAGREQVADQLALRVAPDTVASVLWEQGDPDFDRARATSNREPCHPPGEFVVGGNRQPRLLRPDQPVLMPLPLHLTGTVCAMPEPLELTSSVRIGQKAQELRQVLTRYRPEAYNR